MGQKSGQSVKNWPNKTPFASDLLWESTNSVIGAAVGIHQFLHPTYCGNPLWQFQHPTYCGNPLILSSELLWESINSFIRPTVGIHFGNFSIRPTVGIHQFLHRSCCGNPSIPSSELLWESMRVYNSIRWMYFNNNNYNLRASSHQALSFWIPCSFHLPRGTILEFWPLEKRGCVKCELLFNGMGS